MSRKSRNLEYRRRLDQVLAEFDRPPLMVLDKNKEPFTDSFKVTNVSWEPRILRDIFVNHRSKKAYFVHYDETMRLSKQQIKELSALKLSIAQEDGLLEYHTNLYNGKGYRVIEQGDIIQIDGQFYFNEYKTKNFEKKEPYMPDIAPNLYKIGDDIYEKKGELYYAYPNRDAI